MYFYVIHAVAAILLHRCNALKLLLPSVNCCFSPSWLIVAYFMFPGCHLTKDPANTASNLAFGHIVITASRLLVLTYLLLCALDAAVISLCYFAALLLLIFFTTHCTCHRQTHCCFYNGHCHWMFAAVYCFFEQNILLTCSHRSHGGAIAKAAAVLQLSSLPVDCYSF